jgi:hypothetical protein
VSPDQELLGAASLKLDPLWMTCSNRSVQVGVGCLCRAARVGERVRESFSPCVRCR